MKGERIWCSDGLWLFRGYVSVFLAMCVRSGAIASAECESPSKERTTTASQCARTHIGGVRGAIGRVVPRSLPEGYCASAVHADLSENLGEAANDDKSITMTCHRIYYDRASEDAGTPWTWREMGIRGDQDQGDTQCLLKDEDTVPPMAPKV